MRVLLLGGTTEASDMAKALAAASVDAIFSYAGRTGKPMLQPLPTRTGGFGGVSGMAAFLHDQHITHVVDATHPFAAQISANAFAACQQTGTPLLRLERPPWQPQPGDDWTIVPNVSDLPAALPQSPARIFLAVGKQPLALFSDHPLHHFVVRLVDQPTTPLPLKQVSIVIGRGPFTKDRDLALMRDHRITHIVAKNAGGRGSSAKLQAARELGLPVIMASRPALPGDTIASTVTDVMGWLNHGALRGV